MLDLAFAIPGDLEAATGGYGYARQVLARLPEHGIIAHHLALPGSFPAPSDDDLELTRHLLEQLHPTTPVLFDGLAYGALPPGFLTGVRPAIIALVHHPLAYEAGLEQHRKRALMISERDALRHATAVIATSRTTAHALQQDYDVDPAKLTIAEPGTEPTVRARGTGAPFTMLAVGSLIPRKGYGILIDALRDLEATDWHLTIAGTTDLDPAEANRIREAVLASGNRGRITLPGRVDERELAKLYASADLFVMPSLYEGYGMVLAEALARGLPIVSTTGGAAAETAPDAAAIKVAPGDAAALRWAIETAMNDAPRRGAMASASWQAGQALPSWSECAGRIAGVVKAVVEELTT